MHPQRSLSLGPTTFFASRERCRLPESLYLVDAMCRLRGVPCSVSLRAGGRFIISSSEAAAGNRSEDDVVEIADYDPARHSVLAIGSKEPSPDVAIHWLAYRTDETVAAVAFVWVFDRKKGVEYFDGKHPWGSFPEAMALLTLAKKCAGLAGIEGRGYLVRGRTVEELVDGVAKIIKLNEKKARGTGQGVRVTASERSSLRPQTSEARLGPEDLSGGLLGQRGPKVLCEGKKTGRKRPLPRAPGPVPRKRSKGVSS